MSGKIVVPSRRPNTHRCDVPTEAGRSRMIAAEGIGAVWQCECGRRWKSVKAHLIGGGWEAEWRRVRPWRWAS